MLIARRELIPGGNKASSMSARPHSYVTIQTLAARLEVCTKTVRRWIASGALHAHRLGRSIRISEEDVQAFLSTRRQ